MGIQQKVSKIRGIADVVFCIDFSRSMGACIQGIKEHITAFVNSLERSSPNMTIDWRIGFCGYSHIEFVKYGFTSDVKRFSTMLANASVDGGEEFTPGALDFCINGFEWRPVSNKFIILFTDEVLGSGGSRSQIDNARSNFPDLLQKISDSGIRLFYFGPRCPYFKQFEQLSRAFVTFIENDFTTIDFSSLLNSLGKTVSQSCQGQTGSNLQELPCVIDISMIKITNLN